MKTINNAFLLKTAACLLFLFSVGLFAASTQEQSNRNALLAVVNGEPITLGDVLPYTSAKEFQAYSVLSGEALQKRIIELRSQALEKIIERRLLVEDYNEGTYRMTFSDVENEIDRMLESLGCRTRAELEQKLRASGSNYEKFRKNVEEQMIQQLMYQRESQISDTITPQDVRKYYDGHTAEFTTKTAYELEMFQINKNRSDFQETCDLVAGEFQSGNCDFEQLVCKYSDGPNKLGGGMLGRIEEDKLRSEFAAALAKEKITDNCIVGPIETKNAVIFLKVLKHTPGRVQDFQSVSQEIENRLKNEIRQRNYREYVERLRKNASIQYFSDIKK